MKPLLLTVAVLLLLAGTAWADSPARPEAYVRSMGAYDFVMLAPHEPPLLAPNGQPYPSSGLYAHSGSPEPLWTVDWYAFPELVFLTPDARFLVRMGPWPLGGDYDELAVAFYRDGNLLRNYAVKDLVFNPQRLPQSVSHYEWRHGVAFDPTTLRLKVGTQTGETYQFDVQTGEIQTETITQSPAWRLLPLVLSVPIVVGFGWALWRYTRRLGRTER